MAKLISVRAPAMIPVLVFSFLLLNTALAQQYVISTFAGGAPPPAPTHGLDLSIGSPQGIATDAVGNAYFTASNCAFKQDPNGVITRIAGTTRPSYSGDGGPAVSAELNLDGLGFTIAANVSVDGAGNIFTLYLRATAGAAVDERRMPLKCGYSARYLTSAYQRSPPKLLTKFSNQPYLLRWPTAAPAVAPSLFVA